MPKRFLHIFTSAFFAATLAAAAAAPTPRVAETLLAGGDARAAVAQALAEGATPAAKHSAGVPALTGYARRLQRLGVLAAAAQSGAADRNALRAAIDDLRAQRLLVDARIDTVGRRIAEHGASGTTAQRWQQQAAGLTAWLARVDNATQAVEHALADSKASALPHAVLAELRELAEANAQENRAPIHGANLPVHRPRLPAREPVVTPVVVPAYANAAAESAPLAEDFAEDTDTPLTAEILAKAESLDHNYARIVDFVRSEVKTQWYAGAQKGAQATLRSLAGNDVDQASLLIALLRASRAPARYVRGVLEVPAADLAASLAVRADKVGQALAAAGIANKPVVRGGRIAAYAIEHVWVDAYLPFSGYRGSSAELEGNTWIPLAPAIKPMRHVPSRGALAAAGIAARDFADAYVRQVQTRTPLDRLRDDVTQALARQTPPLAYAEQLAQQVPDAPPLEQLPASLPVPTVAVTGESGRFPEALRATARIVMRDAQGAVALDATLPLAQLVERRVTLAYEPASIEDGNIADRYGGFGQVPPSLIQVRPLLYVAGQPAKHGTGELEMGASHRVEVTFTAPGGTTSFAQDITAGGLASLVLDAQADRPPQQPDTATLPGESDSGAAKLLANFGARYFATWDDADDELARLAGVGVVRPFPAAALVINRYAVTRVAGVTDRLAWDGVALDAALRPAEAFAGVADNRAEVDWTELSALQGSALEHQVFEEQWGVASVSADKGLALATERNIPVVQLSSATGLAGLNQPQPVKDAITAWLARGYVVDVPRDPLTIEAWTGAVWRVRALATGESGFFIAGGLAGGATALPPSLWYLQDLVDILGNAYAGTPNDDPLAGAILALDRSTQDQQGEAGTELAGGLRAIVVDASGRTVRGAPVRFTVTTTDSTLIGPDGEGKSVVVKTDAAGVARVRLKLAEKQTAYGVFRQVPDAPNPQFYGQANTEVTAATANGDIGSGEAFRSYIGPGPVDSLEFQNGGSDRYAVAIGFKTIFIKALDRFGNAVANAPIDLSVTTNPPTTGDCTESNLPTGDAIDAALFKHDQCPVNEPVLTGAACTTPSISILSAAINDAFFFVPPNMGRSTATIVATSGNATRTNTLRSDPAYDSCTGPFFYVVRESTFIKLLDDGTFGTVVSAAPGTLVPDPISATLMKMSILNGRYPLRVWDPLPGAGMHFSLANGSGENARETVPGSYQFDLRVGSPGRVAGTYQFNFEYPPGQAQTATSDNVTRAWSVALYPPQADPPRFELSPYATTLRDAQIIGGYDPADYRANSMAVEILKNGEVWKSCFDANADATLSCAIPRGTAIDPDATYVARTVINDGASFRLQSADTPLDTGQGVIAGYGILPATASAAFGAATTGKADEPPPNEELGLILGRYPNELNVSQDIDVASGTTCEIGTSLGFVLGRDATVSLTFYRAGNDGTPSPSPAWRAMVDEALGAGLHKKAIAPTNLGSGRFFFDLEAHTADGKRELKQGVVTSTVSRRDVLPLGHTQVKGVDLFNGGGTVHEKDVVLGGRGPGISVVRHYSSHRGAEAGYFGNGWSADLDGEVIATSCNQRIVTDTAGKGLRFQPIGLDPDGALRFEALLGYHGTLLQRGLDYDFYTKEGLHQHYAQRDANSTRLSYAEDSNGNRVTYNWQVVGGTPRVASIVDAAGRRVDLTYSQHVVTRKFGSYDLRSTYTLVDSMRAPGNLVVRYEYDADGNLVKATRDDGTTGVRRTAYEYRDYGSLGVLQPDGQITAQYFGPRLVAARDDVDQTTLAYDYELGWSVAQLSSGTWYQPEQRVKLVTEPDHAQTTFAYDGLRGTGVVKTDVTDARSNATHYTLNRYGATEEERNAKGTTTTTWNNAVLQPATIRDALGTVTTYTYDEATGNKTHESIAHASGPRERSWTYWPSSTFTAPYIKDRVDTFTDARGIATKYVYDTHANRTATIRGGVTESATYAPNGDLTTRTDGAGKVWQMQNDANGYPRSVTDPLGNATQTTYDDRGRKLTQTDALQRRTSWTYDARDRVTRVVRPFATVGSFETTAFDDANRQRVTTNARGKVTTTTLDEVGRVLTETNAAGTVSRTYDENGNLKEERDRGNHVTTYEYDELDHPTKKIEPLGRTTLYDVNALGHVLSETTGERVTEYAYDDAEYHRTSVRRKLDSESGTTWVEETTRYDGNANPVESTDGEGRTTTRVFDDRDRVTSETAPLGKVTTVAYDNADRKTVETRANPGGSGTQVRRFGYDDAGRLTTTTDAEGQVRSQGYDTAGNVTSKTDARGNTTTLTYDARNNLAAQTGPEADQQVSYDYDGNNNRVRETWANGRRLTYTYDDVDRLEKTEDADGVMELRHYTPDSLIEWQEDADGRRTRFTYDALHHPLTKTLPGEGTRTVATVYDIHGDLRSETDPRHNTTTHDYDTLGRRLVTTFPVTNGVTATKRVTYDKVGNVLSETNGRNQKTTYTVNALNQRETQTDPDTDGETYTQRWTYDAQGNALTHTDRRGILSVTAYDKENRAIGHARDSLVIDTLTLDAEGNVAVLRDAEGRETRTTYDKANRKTRVQRPLDATESWTYTPEGDVKTSTDADGRTTSYTYTRRRQVETESLAGETTSHTYNGSGQPLTRQRPNGKTWHYGYDSAGRLETVTDPLDHATTFGYDDANNRTTIKDANQHTTTFEYDERNRLVGKEYPGNAAYLWTHDADGNVTEINAPNGRQMSTTYDALNRARVSTYSGTQAGEVTQTERRYDGNANVITIEETRNGSDRVETRSYDPFDRVKHVTNPLTRNVDYRYDDVGNRTQLTDHDRAQTTWSYDENNRNTAIAVPGQGVTQQTHTKAGKLDTLTRPDGSTTTHTYDDAGRIATIVHEKGGQAVARYSYRYDLNGNRIEQKETNGATTNNAEVVTTYHYDDADRLEQVIEPGRTTDYTLDAVGNRTKEEVTVNGTVVSRSILTYNARDQLTSREDAIANVHVTQTYDDNGNLLTQTSNGVERRYTYDARDRMMSLTEGTNPPLTFDYDANGMRLEKTQGGQSTKYQYDQSSLMAETNAIGNTLSRYHYSSTQLISETKAGTTPTQRHYLLDALRSPIAMLTQQGAVSARTRYDAWGEVIAQQGTSGALVTPQRDGAIAPLLKDDEQPVGFTGYLKDNESGLYYAKARYYDPAVARFTTEDPEAGKDMQPPSLHRYLYAYANPTVYIDTTGRETYNAKHYDTWELSWQTDPGRISILRQRIADASVEERRSWQRAAKAAPYVVAAGGLVATAGSMGSLTPALLLGGGTGALSASRQYVTTGSVSADQVALEVGLGGFAGGGLASGFTSASQLARATSAGASVALAAAGAADGGKLVGEGLALGEPGKVAVGITEAALSVVGGVLAANTKSTVVTESKTPTPETLLERRMAINPDNDFGPLNRVPAPAPGDPEFTGPLNNAAPDGTVAAPSVSTMPTDPTKTYIYRGVHEGHPAFADARVGRAVPGNVNGTVTADAHNYTNSPEIWAESPYTSWTRRKEYAVARAGENGIVLRVEAGAPPPGAKWRWETSPDYYQEDELLLRGIREDCCVLAPR